MTAEARSLRPALRRAQSTVAHVRPLLYLALWGSALLLVSATWSAWNSAAYRPATLRALHLAGGGSAFALLGLVVFDRRPLLATVPLALLHTWIGARGLLAVRAWSFGDPWFRSLLYAAYCWAIVLGAVRLVRLARAEPGSYVARRMRGDAGDARGDHVERELAAHHAARRAERRRLAWAAAALALVWGAGLWGALA